MKYLVAALAIILAPQAAFAEEASAPSEGWQSFDIKIRYTGGGIKREMRGVIKPAESIFSGDTNTSGSVILTCVGGSFTASFAPDPIDFVSIITQGKVAKGNYKRKRLDFKINGEVEQRIDWVYIPKLGVYRAGKRSSAAKLYNATIRGDRVEVKTRGKDYQPLFLPPVDTAFRNFGSECGLGIYAKKSS